jgi:hypothetical protein
MSACVSDNLPSIDVIIPINLDDSFEEEVEVKQEKFCSKDDKFVIILDIDDIEDEEEMNAVRKKERESYGCYLDDEDPEVLAMWRVIKSADVDYFTSYVSWYVNMYQGTLEQPYKFMDDSGDYLTAYSYYNVQALDMVEIKLIFDEKQLDNVKTILTQLLFTFSKPPSLSDISDLFMLKESDIQFEGSMYNPRTVYNQFGEEYYAYSAYNLSDKRMTEMRLIFDRSCFDNVKRGIRTAGFIAL